MKNASGPVAHATVWIDPSSGDRRVASAGSDGRFSLTGVPPGRWTVSAGMEAESGSAEVLIPPNALNLRIRLIDDLD